MSKTIVHLIAAARPNFMKVAPLFHALSQTDWCEPRLVHTGQHYDVNMSDVFFKDLSLPDPHFHLGVGRGSHAEQTGGVMIAYERACVESRPDWIVVVGDVNSTAACALVGAKLWIPVAHLEAGLRSGDRRMPEEINRLVTDAIADVLWTPSEDAVENLLREGIARDKIELIGNVMIDSFEMLRGKIEACAEAASIGVDDRDYSVVTLHRPSNVDQRETLLPIVDALIRTAERMAVVFVAHPRTLLALQRFGLYEELLAADGVKLLQPLPYIRFMSVVLGARLVITDSGGIQEETTYLGIPCLTLRQNTERPITVTLGTNRLTSADTLLSDVDVALSRHFDGLRPPLWDGQTAARAVSSIQRRVFGTPQ
jgi:UDP-N-acetylglucosamine 2-epimerase (non-hydrolysing)